MVAVSTITELLQTLSDHNKVSTWKTRCYYADGAGTSVHEIQLSLKDGRTDKILFQMETGKVLKCGNKAFLSAQSVDVIDLLLDIFNEDGKV